MRKWICILLAAGIAAGLMSGCSRNVGTQESAVWQVLETEILAEKADASGEVDFTHDYSEVIKKDLDLKRIANMVKTRIEVFPEIRDHIDFFEELPEYDIAMYTHKKMKTNAETSLKVLKDVLPILEAQEDFSNDALFAALSAYVSETGVKTGFVMWPVRTAVSGKQMTPAGATEIMEVLGKEESLKRIRKGIEMLEA